MSELQTRTARRRAAAAQNEAGTIELAKDLCKRFGLVPWYKAKGKDVRAEDSQKFFLAHAKDMLAQGVFK